MPKKLTQKELNELNIWLQEQGVIYKNLHREFSDVLPLANLLKNFFPKLIDLYNYPSRNNTQLKLINWETINYKVLSKLGIQQNKNVLDKLSKGTPGVIEGLLYNIMLTVRAQQQCKDDKPDEQEQIWTENDDVIMVTVNKKIGDAIVQVPQKMILYSIYEQALRESQAKDSFIAGAQQKITHLENILELKGERIEELSVQLAKVSVRSLCNQYKLENLSDNGLVVDQTPPLTTDHNGISNKKTV